jgi:uncharacterized protein (TIGR02271 family)
MNLQDTLTWRGLDLMGSDGSKIGKIDEIYEDTDTGQPEWALVSTGLFGSKSTFVPLQDAAREGDGISVPYSKAQVKDAPHIDVDGALSHEEEQTLYRHYDIDWGTSTSGSGIDVDDRSRSDAGTDAGLATGAMGATGARFDRDDQTIGRDDDTVGRDTSGPTTDDAMTRSEEELRVGTAKREAGRARLRKYVVTDQVETTVPVQREEVRIEREPITDANRDAALSGPDLTEEEHEVVLHEEQVTVDRAVVPKERVRLEKDTFTEEERVSEEVRKEQIETDTGTGVTGLRDDDARRDDRI